MRINIYIGGSTYPAIKVANRTYLATKVTYRNCLVPKETNHSYISQKSGLGNPTLKDGFRYFKGRLRI